MELRKGMYVITNDRMEIGKIKDFCTCEMCEKRGFYEPIIDNSNIFMTIYDKEGGFHGYKFYDELIDLIRPGDYVNGLRINSITEVDKNNDVRLVWHLNTYGDDDISFSNEEIKSIVTKEQFESVKYEVKENE